ncbi:MAG TPA: amino acid adenylation domain-containing protein [Candidatus Cloacimonadota bacterium]|nr:amino acid adenylation domain-containing protein [Candidatus Cloacimonadota bacterium]HPT71309.1 amino acid adenylation domain-containing protein [Candidatus Cloacimonadota bacterium]
MVTDILDDQKMNSEDNPQEESILTRWNHTEMDYPKDIPIHQLFEMMAEAYPNRNAVVDGSGSITFTELNRQANRIANWLLTKIRLQPETPVCLFMPSSRQFVIAMLGIIKAGGAYVPLDLKFPVERISYIISQTQSPIVLTTMNHSASFPLEGVELLEVDNYESFDGISLEYPITKVEPEQLAYIIFTSGSTGTPKGVAIEHRCLVNLVYWSRIRFKMKGGENQTQTTRIVFDASVWEFWTSLCLGNTLHIVEQHVLLDMEHMNEWLISHEIHIMFMATGIAELFLDSDWHANRTLRVLIAGGDKLTRRPDPDFPAQFTNYYGPTEATMVTTEKIVEPVKDVYTIPTIGKPIANYQCYVLDENLKPVGVGENGQLFIGGDGLARCYYGSPDLTNEAFIPNPFPGTPGDRIYKTGDLVRYTEDGDIDFLGRIDFQVKIRGYRIELGEIESAFLQHPAVNQCIVTAESVDGGDRVLVASIILNHRIKTNTEELKAFVADKIPEYMIPSFVQFLKSYPLTANGKIDRDAMPIPSRKTEETPLSFDEPSTEMEIIIANIWKRILKLDKVSMQDHFYQLGGHSIKGTQILAIVRKEIGVSLDIPFILNNPSLAEFVHAVQEAQKQTRKAITVQTGQDEFPLSWGQHGVWYFWNLDPKRTDFHIPMRIDIEGSLKTDVLKQALQMVVDHHEILRTSFEMKDGVPTQFIHPRVRVELPYIMIPKNPSRAGSSLTNQPQHDDIFPYSNNTPELKDLERRMGTEPFNLQAVPLFRFYLVQCSVNEFILFATFHHIMVDGWSTSIFLRDLRSIYASLIDNQPPLFPELSVRYGDYAVWQKSRTPSVDFSKELQYWKSKLIPFPPELKLPLKSGNSHNHKHTGRRYWWVIDQDLTSSLNNLAQTSNKSLFTTLLAIFKLLLYKYTQQTDIVIGSSYAGRTEAELENVMGVFTNVLALRTSLEGNPTFMELLDREQQTTSYAFANANYPFDQLVIDLGYKTEPNKHPIFQVMFLLQNYPDVEREYGGVKLHMIEIGNLSAKFDLLLTIEEYQEKLICWYEYNAAILDDEIVQRMSDQFTWLCTQITRKPLQRIDSFEVLLPKEKEKILEEWNQTMAKFTANKTYPEIFDDNLAINAKAAAVYFKEKRLTYKELNIFSNRMAHMLLNHGVEPDTIIGVCLERSIELPIALLSVWKTGCAYLPLDHTYPSERLNYMIEDSGAKIILTQQSLMPKLPSDKVKCICLDDPDTTWTADSPEPLPVTTKDDSIAYVIYTSGSTGKPKGVQITQRNLVHHNLAVVREFGLTSKDRVLQFGSISFDLSIEEIFPTWLAGATLIMRTDEVLTSLEHFLDFIETEQISVLDIPTAYWHELVYLLTERNLPNSVRLVIIGGEKALPDKLAIWHNHVDKNVKLLNTYGPTETTVIATIYEPKRDDVIDLEEFPIGKPISNIFTYVLNKNLQPVPIGVSGELYIGGICVGAGYINRPDLTAERFLKNPFANHPKERIYKTGDIVKYRFDGNLIYLGRSDDQVKFLGHRIELHEIEMAISKLPDVKNAVVILSDDNPDHQSLVAYIVPDIKQPDLEKVKSNLLTVLPDYMIPSQFIFIKELPFTTSGKIDKKALPKPGMEQHDKLLVFPRTSLEKRIAGIWQKVLNLQQVDVISTFNELGGHSLKAMLAVALLEKEFKTKIDLQTFVDHPNIASLASYYEGEADTEEKAVKSDIIPIPRDKDSYTISYSEEGLWFLWEMDQSKIAYNIPLSFSVKGFVDQKVFSDAIHYLINRHEVFKTNFRLFDGIPKKILDKDIKVNFDIVDISDGASYEKEANAIQMAKQLSATPFNLYSGPLYKATLLKLADDNWRFILVIHHIVADGWSFALFMSEFQKVYQALTEGKEPELHELQIQYIDYAVWQRDLFEKELKNIQAHYWKNKLSPLPEPIQLPIKGIRPAEQSYQGKHVSMFIPNETYEVWKNLVKETNTSLFTVLLCGLNILLYRYSGQEDLIVGTPFANRKDPALEDVMGCFTNMLALRTPFTPEDSINVLLKKINQTCLEAFSHSDYPLNLLIPLLQVPRDTSRHPLYQVMLTLQNYPIPDFSFSGIKMKPNVIPNGSAKVDLSLSFAETEDGLEGILEYDSELFEQDFCKRMADNFIQIMNDIASNLDVPVSEIAYLTPEEENRILIEINQTETELPAYNSVLEWIENTAKQYPDKSAIIFDKEEIKYSELMKRVYKTADFMLLQGVSHGDRIGIFLDRSPEMLIFALAAWAIGCSYLYLDPEFPDERLNFMKEDTSPKFIIVNRNLSTRYQVKPLNVYILEDIASKIDKSSESRPSYDPQPDDIGYLIFTSGSTGKPKGVAILQESIINFLYSMQQKPGLTPEDRLLAITPMSFDISALEMYLPLVTGATSIILERQRAMSGGLLASAIEEYKTTLIQATPSTYKLLLDNNWQGNPNLVALSGGEAISQTLAHQLVGKVKALWNMYGPTETTVWSTIYQIKSSADPILIGKPIANTQVYILDALQKPVPFGAWGELYIGGKGVALGYWNRSELTSRRFLRNPFQNDQNERIYKTGDVVRFKPDGNLEYFGRNDFQVKIRGHRIELGEISELLRKHPAVKDAVIIADDGQYDQKQLVGYLILHPQERPDKAEIRQFLRKDLPDYMIPNIYILLESFPLTANGKIDQNALPKPKIQEPVVSGEIVEAKTPEQELLIRAVKDILHLQKVGINDNFFDIGGNSILSMQLISRVSQAGLALTIDHLFRHRNLEELASWMQIKTDEKTFGSFSLVELRKGNPKYPPLFLIHPLPGDVLGYVNLVRRIDPEQPVYGFQAYGLLDPDKAHKTIPEMAAYYISIIEKMNIPKGYMLAGWCYGGSIAFEMAQQLRTKGITLPNLFLFDTFAFNPVDELKKRYSSHRMGVYIKNTFRIPHLIRVKLKEKKNGYQVMFDRENIFQEQGIFINRSIVRMINLESVFKWTMDWYPGRITVFSAKVQHPSMMHDKEMAWKIFADRYKIHRIDATHDNILKEPQVIQIVEIMNEYLKYERDKL